MNKYIKIPFAKQTAKQRSAVAKLCIICALFFIAACSAERTETTSKTPSEGTESLLIDEEPTYYYYAYQGMESNPMYEKAYISLNTKYISLSLKEPQLPADIAQRGYTASDFQCDYFDRWPDKMRDCIYWTELSIGEDFSTEKYLELLADLKQKNRDVIVGPFFNNAFGEYKAGTGYYFQVKLKSEEDVVLLEQMTEQTRSVILEQNGFMPLFFRVSVTENSELNALECANIFYESGLFQGVQWMGMCDSEGKMDWELSNN